VKLLRIKAGLYRLGNTEVRDTYSPDGAPHTRWVTLTRNRWLVTVGTTAVARYDTLRDARQAVEAQARQAALRGE
jgi:hypothetical protein